MKRRKTPIILITVLVICAALVFILNPPPPGKADAQAAAPTAETAPQTDKDIPVPGKSTIANDVANSISPVNASKPKMPHGPGPGMPGGPPNDKPSIMVDKPIPFKPMPSDTNVNSGWYTDKAPKTYAAPKQPTPPPNKDGG